MAHADIRSVALLGSTGSIGTQTIELLKECPGRFRIVGLAAKANIDLLEEQIRICRPKAVAVEDEEKADLLSTKLENKGDHTPVFSGPDAVLEIAALPEADIVLNAVVGSAGIRPTVAAIARKKIVAIANKETIVAAGGLVMEMAKSKGVPLIPVDSEHSAIFQCIQGSDAKSIRRVILTCSGGPFRGFSADRLKGVDLRATLNHPKWKMGRKITVDSATLMNKGFEVIEAKILFSLKPEQVEVVVHPESVVHSLVELEDTSMLAQLGLPSMKVPIQYALSYPDRWKNMLKSFDIASAGAMTFEKPDMEVFPCLRYAYDALRIGGSMPAALNAANEVAVDALLQERINFTDIPMILKHMMESHKAVSAPSIDKVLAIDKEIKGMTGSYIEERWHSKRSSR